MQPCYSFGFRFVQSGTVFAKGQWNSALLPVLLQNWTTVLLLQSLLFYSIEARSTEDASMLGSTSTAARRARSIYGEGCDWSHDSGGL